MAKDAILMEGNNEEQWKPTTITGYTGYVLGLVDLRNWTG